VSPRERIDEILQMNCEDCGASSAPPSPYLNESLCRDCLKQRDTGDGMAWKVTEGGRWVRVRVGDRYR